MTTKKSPSDRSVVDKISDAVYPRLEKVIESEREKGSREVLVQSLVYLGIATALMKLLVQHGLTPALAIESFAKGHRLTEEQLEAMDRRLYRGIVEAVETHLGNEADLIGFRMDFSWRGKAPGGAQRGTAGETSDLDLLIEVDGPTSPWFPGGLVADLEAVLGCRVDVVESDALRPEMRERALAEAVPL